jgi:hypothetical protein
MQRRVCLGRRLYPILKSLPVRRWYRHNPVVEHVHFRRLKGFAADKICKRSRSPRLIRTLTTGLVVGNINPPDILYDISIHAGEAQGDMDFFLICSPRMPDSTRAALWRTALRETAVAIGAPSSPPVGRPWLFRARQN